MRERISSLAGKVWGCLGQHGPLTLPALAAKMGEEPEAVFAAVGWLTREEHKIVFERVERDGQWHTTVALSPTEQVIHDRSDASSNDHRAAIAESSASPGPATAVVASGAGAGISDPEPRDPVCGMQAHRVDGHVATHSGIEYVFCSDFCRREFLSAPGRYENSSVRSKTASEQRTLAYFSMEIALDPGVPTYAGGLGILAGDTLRSMADLAVPAIAVTLISRRGYFQQRLDEEGNQREDAASWDPSRFARLLSPTVTVSIHGRPVRVQAWEFVVRGQTGATVPVLLLDADFGENHPEDRRLTDSLYGGDQRYRIAQELILGVGGVRMLQALGHDEITRFHLNEGHSSLLLLELLRRWRDDATGDWNFGAVQHRCVFTTHTPVPAGHDQFSYELFQEVAGNLVPPDLLRMLGGNGALNLTLLALNLSHRVNGVAKRHGIVTQEMFPGYPVNSITNGVHSGTWVCPAFRELFDQFIPGWINDPSLLRHAVHVPTAEILQAHRKAKETLVESVRRQSGERLIPELLTIGFARRAAQYKRMDLVFRDLSRLTEIAAHAGLLQFVFAGKAHPGDESGMNLIRNIFRAGRELRGRIHVVYLENYGWDLARVLTAGCDLWLNTPRPPQEASGTSGMKAAHNGVPSLSVLDGWWLEGHLEGLTGWSIGRHREDDVPAEEMDRRHADELYDKLEKIIAPLFYLDRNGWAQVMRNAIAFNAAFFNTHRMVQQYAANAWM